MGNELRFDGQVALITGGGAGIGRAHALRLASRGAKIVVMDYGVASQGGEKKDEGGREHIVANEIKGLGGEAIGVYGNVFNDADARLAVKAAMDAFGRLDILVNNAGTSETRTPVQDEPGPYFENQLNVHLRGTLMMSRAAWPFMKSQGYGRILNTGSAVCFGYQSPATKAWAGGYGIAKSALIGTTRQLAGAGRECGIKANMILPWGYTRIVSGAGLDTTDLGKWMKAALDPLKVADSALYLLHRECPVSGQLISTAGGRVARILLASTTGYINQNLTPEDVRDNWSVIHGDVSEDGYISNLLELSGQAAEWKMLMDTLK